jgi:hypothetical protein
MSMRGKFSLLFSLAFLACPVTAQQTDNDTGLIIADGWDTVRATCTECHSAQLITQNSGSRAVWQSRIEWMQDTQGLQQLVPELEDIILQYLSDNYGPKQASRRAGLPSHLMPANPYPVD